MADVGTRVVALIVMAALRLTALLPLRVSQAIGRLIGYVNLKMNTRAAMVTRANVAICFPDQSERERERLIRRSLSETGKTLMETPAAWLGGFDRLSAWIRNVEGEEILDNALAEGRGVITLLPHLGNWELFNAYYARKGKFTGLYSPPRKKYLVDLMSEIRHGFGNELVPANVKGIATLYRRLGEGQVVTVLPDQVPTNGVYVPFFGVAALTDRLVPRLLQKTGARAVMVYIRRLKSAAGFEVVFREPDPEIYDPDMDVSAKALNASVEACVREALEQYQWEYKRYRERPAGERKLYRFNRPEAFH